MQTVSKSQLKSQLLEYLRRVEEKKKSLIVTHGGKPVIKVSPYRKDSQQVLKSLRGLVTHFKNPTEPVGENDWEALNANNC